MSNKSLLMTPANARAVREHPILFSAPMVRAILTEAKTQTRRVIRKQPVNPVATFDDGIWSDTQDPVTRYFGCPYGQPGDTLAVKEATWMWCERIPDGLTKTGRAKWRYVANPDYLPKPVYCADQPAKPAPQKITMPDTGNQWSWRYKSARFMPAWAVRTWVKLEEVRVQRVQEISREDVIAEGVERVDQLGVLRASGWKDYSGKCAGFMGPLNSFRTLWDSINAARGHGWDKNDWCWCLTFRRVEGEGRAQ